MFIKFQIIVFIVLTLSSCINKISVSLKNKKTTPLNATVSNIQVINHQVVITGTNLTSVSNFKIKDGGTDTTLAIESNDGTTLIANTLTDVTFAAGKILDFIISNANASATYTVNFSISDAK